MPWTTPQNKYMFLYITGFSNDSSKKVLVNNINVDHFIAIGSDDYENPLHDIIMLRIVDHMKIFIQRFYGKGKITQVLLRSGNFPRCYSVLDSLSCKYIRYRYWWGGVS